MNQKEKICLTFAGPVGSSKTPIAYFLSYKFGLPILNNDAIRTEVAEDLIIFSQAEYEKRRDERLISILATGHNFIYDASVDRRWKSIKEKLVEFGYGWFIISIDLSKEFLIKVHEAKGYREEGVDQLIEEHNKFLKEHGEDVNLHVSDRDFSDRLALSTGKFESYLGATEVL